jgi:hypothetical protein
VQPARRRRDDHAGEQVGSLELKYAQADGGRFPRADADRADDTRVGSGLEDGQLAEVLVRPQIFQPLIQSRSLVPAVGFMACRVDTISTGSMVTKS